MDRCNAVDYFAFAVANQSSGGGGGSGLFVVFQCPMDLDTCVNRHKLIDFLAMKFIPGRTLLPEDMDKGRGVSEGHIFTEKTIPASPRVLMADWVAYILGRPKEAVPKEVRLSSGDLLSNMSYHTFGNMCAKQKISTRSTWHHRRRAITIF